MDRSVSSATLGRVAGISYRRVDYWTRQGLLRPVQAVPANGRSYRSSGNWEPTPESPGSGYARRYPVEEVGVAYVMRRLIDDVGVSITRAHLAARGYVEGETAHVVMEGVTIVLGLILPDVPEDPAD